MFKRFDTRIGLEQWLKNTTGNNGLTFRSDYGEIPYLNNLKIFDRIPYLLMT